MNTWIATRGGDFINLDHVWAIEAMQAKSNHPEFEEGWLLWAVFPDRSVRLPGSFTLESEAQARIHDLLGYAGANIIDLAT